MGGGILGKSGTYVQVDCQTLKNNKCYFTTGDYILKTKYSVYPYRIFTL